MQKLSKLKKIIMIIIVLIVITIKTTVLGLTCGSHGKGNPDIDLFYNGVYCLDPYAICYEAREYYVAYTITIKGSTATVKNSKGETTGTYEDSVIAEVGYLLNFNDSNYWKGYHWSEDHDGIHEIIPASSASSRQKSLWYREGDFFEALDIYGFKNYTVYGDPLSDKIAEYDIDTATTIYNATIQVLFCSNGYRQPMLVVSNSTEENRSPELKVIKKDRAGSKLAGMKFIIQTRIGNQAYWLAEKENGGYDFEGNSSTIAKVFTTNANGEKLVTKLSSDYKYRVWEIETPNAVLYPMKEQITNGRKSTDTLGGIKYEVIENDEYYYFGGYGKNGAIRKKKDSKDTGGSWYTAELGETVEITLENKAVVGNLKVYKEDATTHEKLRMGFKVQVKIKDGVAKWLSGDGSKKSPYKYTNSYDKGDLYRTDQKTGTYLFNKLAKAYQYRVWEVETANDEYPLKEQINGENGEVKTSTSNGYEVIQDDKYYYYGGYGEKIGEEEVQGIGGEEGVTVTKIIRGGAIRKKLDSEDTNGSWMELKQDDTIPLELQNKKMVGKLDVQKIDSITGQKLNMGFKVQIKIRNGVAKWLSGNGTKSSPYVYTNSYNDGETYNTPSGRRVLNNLSIKYQYRVWEVISPDEEKYPIIDQIIDGRKTTDKNGNVTIQNNYYLYYSGYGAKGAIRKKFDEKDTNQSWQVLTDKGTIEFKFENRKKTGTLVVKKIDKEKLDENKKHLKLNMGFKVHIDQKGWLSGNGSDRPYVYTNIFEDGETYHTNNGECTLEGLIVDYRYRIWETESPDPIKYPLKEQHDICKVGVKYDEKFGLLLKDYFNVEYNDKNEPTTVELENVEVPISISGFVWVDHDAKGDGSYDNLYKDNDKLLKDVKVTLFKKKEDHNKEGTAVGDPVYTDSTGKYTFGKEFNVKYSELTNYYVEFCYYDYSSSKIPKNIDGASGKYYIPVVYNATAKNGSRALVSNMHGNDDAVFLEEENAPAGERWGRVRKARTYRGIGDNNYGVNTQKYGLEAFTKLYNSGNRTLENINLGIRKIYDPKYSIAEDLKYVVIKVNKYQYTYKYGTRDWYTTTGVPTVQVENTELKTYSRPIYPSDIYHLRDNDPNIDAEDKIKVYAIYDISIKNDEVREEKNLYVEDMLHITSLTNTFSTERYILDTNNDVLTNSYIASIEKTNINNMKNDIESWTKTGENGGVGEVKYNSDNIEIAAGGLIHKYIQFKVTDDEIRRILDKPDGIEEKPQTTAHTNGYHSYTRNEYAWENLTFKEANYNLIYENRLRKSVSKKLDDKAPYLKFTLAEEGKEREITGKVFEDLNVKNNGEVLGNGKYDENKEKIVKSVGVVLVDNSGNPIKRYTKDKPKGTTEIIKTDEHGDYAIKGVLPGDYYLKFIYDNNSVIKDKGNVNVKDYKSTIITNDAIKNAFGYGDNEYGNVWYKHLGDDLTYSVAVDNFGQRKAVNGYVAEGQSVPTSMFATSPEIGITVENTLENGSAMDDSNYNFSGFYFGIITQPEQKVEVDKKITNIKLVNSPNIVFDVNPGKSEASGVTDLDGNSLDGGSTYTRVEIEEGSIYGSEFEVTYDVTVKNVSNINYYETVEANSGWYYKYGKHDSSYSKEYEIDMEAVTDLYDTVLQYIDKEPEGNKTIENKLITICDSQEKEAIEIIKREKGAWGEKDFKEALEIKGWGEIARTKSATKQVTFKKILSSENDDLNYINGAKVSKAKLKEDRNATESYLYAKPVNLGEPAYAESVISAPTGNVREYITRIAIIGLIGILTTMGIGIVILKKKNSKINYLR